MAKPTKHGKNWRARPVDEFGKRISLIGHTYAEAELLGKRFEAEVAEIKAGLRLSRPKNKIFAELCEYYLENKTPEKRNQKDDRSIISRHLRPILGHLQLSNMSLEHVDDIKNHLSGKSPKTINNVLTLLGSMFRTALDLKWALHFPKIRKPKSTGQCPRIGSVSSRDTGR